MFSRWRKAKEYLRGILKSHDELTRPSTLAAPHPPETIDGKSLPAIHIDMDPSYVVRVMQARGELYKWLNDIMKRLLFEMYEKLDDAPPVEHLYLVIYKFGGLAFTKSGGKGIKEVHISSTYLDTIPDDRKINELEGVLCHEMVHAFQYDGIHTAPRGFIEGIADYYRLKLGLAPPHWSGKVSDRWDAGYEKTGYFLSFVDKLTPNAVRQMNLYLRDHEWSEERMFKFAAGDTARRLHSRYVRTEHGG